MTLNQIGTGFKCLFQRCSSFHRGAVLTVLLMSISVVATHAQSAVDGAIGGTVLDSTGAVVPSATVLAISNGTNARQTAVTDSSGYFRIIHLQPGPYTVTVTAAGFESFRSSNLTVQVGLSPILMRS